MAWFFAAGARDTFALYLRPWSQEFGWSTASISLAASVNFLANGLSAPFVGLLVDRIGPKRVILVLVSLVAVVGLGLSRLSSLWQLYLLFGVLYGVGTSLSPAATSLIAQWFQKRRGIAFSLAPTGHMIGAALLVPVAAALMVQYGWRTAWLSMAIATVAIGLPVVWIAAHERSRERVQSSEAPAMPDTVAKGVSLRGAAATPTFWLLLAGFALCGYTARSFVVYVVAIGLQGGLGSVAAGAALSGLSLAAVIGLLASGLATDRIGKKPTLVLFYGLRTLGFTVALVFLLTGAAPLFYLGAAIVGFFARSTEPPIQSLLVACYGQRSLGAITGSLLMAHQIGAATGTFVGGVVFDVTGSYAPFLAMNIGLMLVATMLAGSIREHRPSRAPGLATA